VPPQDSVQDMRSEMLGAMAKMGVKVEKHHHEVASAQHELGMKFDTLTLMADQMQIYKYVSTRSRTSTAKTATFMRSRSLATTARACTSTSRSGRTASRYSPATSYADLSETCLTTSAASSSTPRRFNAFTNRRPNSYKRLVPGYEAPVCWPTPRATARPPAASPTRRTQKAKRVEVRFPDPMANPYLAFAAMLMAGLDGIKNKIDPGPAMDKDLYDLPKEELKQIPTVCGSLRGGAGKTSTRTARSSRTAACSTTTSSTPSSS